MTDSSVTNQPVKHTNHNRQGSFICSLFIPLHIFQIKEGESPNFTFEDITIDQGDQRVPQIYRG